MPKALPPGACYANRRPDIAVFQISLERDALALLRTYAGPGKTVGRLVSRLIYEHHARMEERTRLTPTASAVGYAGADEP